MENIIGNSFDKSLMVEWIKEMSGFGPRRAGSPAGHKNEDFLMEQLRNFGLEAVNKEPIPISIQGNSKSRS